MKKWLLISLIIVSIIGYNLWPIFDSFYKCVALCFLISSKIILDATEKYTIERRIAFVWLFITMSNLVDELFFNPKSFNLNEYIFVGLIIAHQTYLHSHARPKP